MKLFRLALKRFRF